MTIKAALQMEQTKNEVSAKDKSPPSGMTLSNAVGEILSRCTQHEEALRPTSAAIVDYMWPFVDKSPGKHGLLHTAVHEIIDSPTASTKAQRQRQKARARDLLRLCYRIPKPGESNTKYFEAECMLLQMVVHYINEKLKRLGAEQQESQDVCPPWKIACVYQLPSVLRDRGAICTEQEYPLFEAYKAEQRSEKIEQLFGASKSGRCELLAENIFEMYCLAEDVDVNDTKWMARNLSYNTLLDA